MRTGLSPIIDRAAILPDIGDPSALILSVGYLAVFLLVAADGVFPIFPGETSIVVAAVFAAEGDLNIWMVILAGAAGSVVGDSAAFWIGRGGGGWIRRSLVRTLGHDRVVAGEHMVHRQGDLLIFTQRFLPGLRLAINIALGAGRTTFRRFLAIDTVAGIVWSAQAAAIGYLSGWLFPGKTWLALVVALSIAGVLILVIIRREHRRMREEQALIERERAQRQ